MEKTKLIPENWERIQLLEQIFLKEEELENEAYINRLMEETKIAVILPEKSVKYED